MDQFVRFKNRTVTQNFTRPANVTAYAAGQVVTTLAGAVITFQGASRETNGMGMIQMATLIDEANVSPKPDLQLWLFDTAPAAVADGAPFNPSNTELEALVAVIAFPTGNFAVGGAGVGAAGNSTCNAQALQIPFNTVGTNNSALFGVLVARNSYVPVSAEKFVVRLTIMD
jgi:hypothetical protein